MTEHTIKTPEAAREYVFAGKAHFTLRSKKTGNRFTYRMAASDDGKVHFLGVLTGTDNDSHYEYAGIVDNAGKFRVTKNSRFAWDAPSVQAFEWFYGHLQAGRLHDGIELWHDGRCGRCHRHLTTPESVERGIGPECAQILGVAA